MMSSTLARCGALSGRWALRVLAAAAALLFAVLGEAKIGAAHQLLLGNPSNAVTDPAVKNNYLIVRDQFAISYNDSLGQPNWVSWNLTQEDRGGSGRSPVFFEDPDLPAGFYRVTPSDYNNSGYSRGHMCPSGDRTVTRADNDVTFYMSNMVPQTSHNNAGVWEKFESATREFAAAGNEVLVITGPSHFSGARITSGVAAIPGQLWKIVVVVPAGTSPVTERITTSTRVIAIKVPNVTSGLSDDWRVYLTSVNQIQQDTGFTFFTTLPSSTASVLRTMIDGQPLVGAPVIEQNPVSQTVAAGGSASFTVTASGDAPLGYQWQRDGQPINGATNATLTLNSVTIADLGSYRVTVTNNVSSAVSEAATLTVTGVAPSFTTHPASQTVGAGESVVFTAAATGSPTLSYQWRRGGQPIDGATAATLTLANAQAADAGSYDVVATNSVTSVTSNAASLTVTPRAPVITVQPVSRSVGLNGSTSLSVTASGTEPLSYQWRRAGVPVSGNATATTATLALTGVTESTAGSYDVVITNSLDSVTSDAVTVTISSFTNGALNFTGGSYGQNFDSLLATHGYDSQPDPNNSAISHITGNGPHQLTAAPFNGTELGGWWIAKYSGTGANARFKVDDGTAVNGAIYSYGSNGSTDRALGSLGSGSTVSRFGLMLNNNTGQTLTEFTISYTGEQWREGNSAANTLAFSYAIDPTDLNTGTYVSAPALSFTAPQNTSTSTSGVIHDGNAPANRRAISATVSGLVWPAGSRLVIRWTDTDDTNNDDGLAVDDFVFTAANSGPVAPAIISTTPAGDATGQSPATAITVTFNQPVTLAADWFTVRSAASGALSATASGGPASYTLTPAAAFAFNDTITVEVRADRVTDTSTGTLNLPEDYSFSFTVATPTAPSITTHPASQTVLVGGNVTFTVAASGTSPFTYQWRKGGSAIPNATSASLALTNVQVADAGSYDVVVTGPGGTATSNAATLTVSTAVPDTITWNFSTAAPSSTLPAGVTGGTVAQGNNVGSSTTLIDPTAPSSGYTGASGGNNAGLGARTGALNTADGGSSYWTFTLTPDTGKRLVVSAVSFAVRRSSTGPQAWALYSSVDNYTNALATGTVPNASTWYLSTPTISTVTGALDTAVTFRLYGYNGTGTYTGGSANFRMDDLAVTVTVQTAPVISVSPASRTATAGDTVNFSVSATGNPTPTYQWRRNGQNISAGTNSSAATATLTLVNVATGDAGSYDVVVTNAAGSATSSSATLTVELPPDAYTTWRNTHFTSGELANPAISGPDVVLTADGLTNLMKYALGLDPRTPASSGLPEPSATATHWVYTYTRPADRSDLTYVVESSTNLVDWTPVSPAAILVGTQNGVQTWQATSPNASAPRLFFRLKVTRP